MLEFLLERRTIHVEDVQRDPEYHFAENVGVLERYRPPYEAGRAARAGGSRAGMAWRTDLVAARLSFSELTVTTLPLL